MSIPDEDFDVDFEIPDVDAAPTPESRFYGQQTAMPAPKIENARIWLWQCLAPIASLMGDSAVNIVRQGKSMPMALIARELLRHYYQMYYHPKFNPTLEGVESCDMDKFLDLICDHVSVRKTVAQAEIELARQRG